MNVLSGHLSSLHSNSDSKEGYKIHIMYIFSFDEKTVLKFYFVHV